MAQLYGQEGVRKVWIQIDLLGWEGGDLLPDWWRGLKVFFMEGMISALGLNNRYDVDKYRDKKGGGKCLQEGGSSLSGHTGSGRKLFSSRRSLVVGARGYGHLFQLQ